MLTWNIVQTSDRVDLQVIREASPKNGKTMYL